MKKIGWFVRLSNQLHSSATIRRIAGGIGVAALLMAAGIAGAQNPASDAALPAPDTRMSTPNGYYDPSERGSGRAHGRVFGQRGHVRLAGQSAVRAARAWRDISTCDALPGKKGTLVDSISAIGSGFGGDPNNFAKLDFSKGKFYEFSGLFRRDRQYFDYDLLGNPNIPSGQSIPVARISPPRMPGHRSTNRHFCLTPCAA